MIYLQHRPAPPLDRAVRMLWCAQAGQLAHRRERVLPNGCVQIVVNLARDYTLDCLEGQPAQRNAPSLLVGARSVYEIVDTSDLADMIGIVFEPGGFPPFAGDAAHLFSNRSFDLAEIWGAEARSLRDRLRDAPSPATRLAILDSALRSRFAGRLDADSRFLPGALQCALYSFSAVPAIGTVAEVARSTGLSARRLSQLFREQVGLTPKVWCRVQRFQRAVRCLHAGRPLRWTELALDCGYYDQSHFANEFRAFSGMDITSYAASRPSPWANHVRLE